jgi:hypothetical protein
LRVFGDAVSRDSGKSFMQDRDAYECLSRLEQEGSTPYAPTLFSEEGILLPVQLPSLSAVMRRTNMTFPCNIGRRRLASECTALGVSDLPSFDGNTATGTAV